MRFSVVAIAASLAVVASAESAYFPFPPEGACVAACTDRVGKARFADYNDVDEYGPMFIESLSYTFESGSPKTGSFMMDAGMCMTACSAEEQQLYRDMYTRKKEWYNANKNGTPPPRPVPTPTTTTTTTTVAPSPSPTTPAVDPAFPFQPNGACVAKCTNDAGKSLWADYSEDPKSPFFWQSLAFSYVAGSPNNMEFMKRAGMCMAMAPCPKPEMDLYKAQYAAQRTWYNANKPVVTAPPVTTIAPTPTTTTTSPPTTTTLPPGVDPAYPFLPDGPCVANCINTVGKSMFPNYSEDPKSPYFWESLSYTFDQGSDKTGQFMSAVGMCQGKCPPEENKLYIDQYTPKLEFYKANKPKPSGSTSVTTTTTTTTTTAGPVPTTPSGGFDYPFQPNGACVAGCTNKVGKAMFPNYSEDPKSPYFIQSLAYTFESGSPNTSKFMMDAGMCMVPCPKAELDLYRAQYPAQKVWYLANKNGGGNPNPGTTIPVTSTTATTTTTTSGPVPTTPSGGFNYPFKPNGPCVSGCTNKVGKAMFPNYSEDPKSPYFIQSLAFTFESGSPNTSKFMMEAGMCMTACNAAEQQLYRAQYPAQKEWYLANKNGGGNPPTKPTTTAATTSGPQPTGPVNPPSGGFNYPFKPNGPCVTGCTNKVGKAMFPNYSEDPKSPYFIQSLAYTFESGSANTGKFMMDAGMCMTACSAAEQQLYRDQYPAQKEWYLANKNGGGNPTNPPVTPPVDPVTPPVGPVTPPSGGFNYPFKPNGPCVTGCTNKVGKAMFPNYSEDPKSPYFIQSLAYTFESGSANTGKFMMDAGMCMTACSAEEQQLYRDQYPAQKEWYLANKNAGGGGGNPTDPTNPVGPIDPNNPVGPPTGPITPPAGGFNYPFQPNGPCVAGCTDKVGKTMFPNYSEDPKSPYFIQSLAYTFESGSANTGKFMTDAGICMTACPVSELDLYKAQYPAQKEWYLANKNAGNDTLTPSGGATPSGGVVSPTPGTGTGTESGATKFAASGLAGVLALISVGLAF